MTAAATLIEPAYSFRAFAREEERLRSEYLCLDDEASDAEFTPQEIDAVVKDSARLLELFLVSACALEVLTELGARSFAEAGQSKAFFRHRIREISGLDPRQVVVEVQRHLAPLPDVRTPQRQPRISALVRQLRAIVDICPVDALEALASAHGLEEWGHRCRQAYEGIQGFIARNDPRQKVRLEIAGREYASGALTLDQVAALLEISRSEAVAFLESHGYVRPLEVIRLSPDEREARFHAMRQDRLRRGGRVPFSADRVARDVVASERIEGVDARRWVPRAIL